MRFEKRWCAGCSFLVFDPHRCPNAVEASPRAELPIAFRAFPARPPAPLMLLPIPRVEIAGGACCMITTEPWIAFRPLRFHVAPEIAPYFDLLDLRFGNVSKFANVGSVPASCFVPPTDVSLEELERVPFDNIAGIGVIPCGMGLLLNVQNRAPHPLAFRAMIAGHGIG